MSKRHRLHLQTTPILITKLRRPQWESGVLLLPVNSGPDQGLLALTPNMALQFLQTLNNSLTADPASPLNRPQRSPAIPEQSATAEEGAKP